MCVCLLECVCVRVFVVVAVFSLFCVCVFLCVFAEGHRKEKRDDNHQRNRERILPYL